MALQGKRLVLVGLGREGWSTYRWLRQVFPQQRLTLADINLPPKLDPHWSLVLAGDPLITIVTGPDYLQAIENQDILFMTPGLRTDLPEIQAALAAGARLHSQTQLFFELCPGQIVGVTGTKGKSTTASLIYHVLHENEVPSVLVGNIGLPALDKLGEVTSQTTVVAELSSHQLQHLTRSPHIAVVQNITSEHLDYYPTTEAYVAAKTAITRFQTKDDWVVFQRSFESAAKMAALGQARPLTYRIDPTPAAPSDLVWLEDGQLWVHPSPHLAESVIPVTEIPLLGHHNLYNVAPAVVVGSHLGLSPKAINRAIRSFRSLPHRLQKIASVGGVDYYDDSLSTTPEATIAALAGFSGKPIVLIAGGHERHQDFHQLAQVILKSSVKGLVLFAPTGERLWETVKEVFVAERTAEVGQKLPTYQIVTDMPAAVAAARKIAQPGDVVLLSPASASFGLFKDYHDRGVQFAEAAKG